MSRPCSTDLRKRAERDHLTGGRIRIVAARISVSASSVPKRVARYRETGNTAPTRIDGHRLWPQE